jgi:myo-inositol 2-dehydrogenase/D-chiro-inositol 1-dehydrogenase
LGPTVTVRVGLVGLGAMGRTHLQVLRSLGDVAVVAGADVNPAALSSAGLSVTYGHPLELVRDADVDAVLVASSDPSHAELVLACLDRRLPVLCEKPLTMSSGDARRILDAEASIGRRLVQVGFMRRFDAAFGAVADAVHAGAVGPPAVISTVHRNPVSAFAFEPSVLVGNSASHDVDLVRWLTGDEVSEVTCESAAGADRHFASVLLRLTTRGGVLASTELTYGEFNYDVRCEVVGRTGALSSTVPDHGTVQGWAARFAQAYRDQDAQWIASVRSGVPVGATAWDGYANVLVLEAATRAWRTGQRVAVEQPVRPDTYR